MSELARIEAILWFSIYYASAQMEM